MILLRCMGSYLPHLSLLLATIRDMLSADFLFTASMVYRIPVR